MIHFTQQLPEFQSYSTFSLLTKGFKYSKISRAVVLLILLIFSILIRLETELHVQFSSVLFFFSSHYPPPFLSTLGEHQKKNELILPKRRLLDLFISFLPKKDLSGFPGGRRAASAGGVVAVAKILTGSLLEVVVGQKGKKMK